MANLRPPNSTAMRPVSHTIKPLAMVENILAAKTESPKTERVIFASMAMKGGTSL
jgi:hypothetical protein